MTILFVALGAVAAAAGTRLAALAFLAAAVSGGSDAGLAAISTWTAALAAAWLLFADEHPRAMAIAAIGAGAVLAAGSAPNGAVVLGLWLVGSAAVIVEARTKGSEARRAGAALLATDVIFAAALIGAAATSFEGWPATLRAPGAWALLASAALRAVLGGPASDGSVAALLVARAQTAILISTALAVGAPGIADVTLLFGCAGFALAPLVFDRGRADGLQELGLFAIAAGAQAAGWGLPAWTWGALAAGTLVHQLRFTLDRAADVRLSAALRRALIGLPFLPVVLAQLEGAFREGGWAGAVVLFATASGLAARTHVTAEPPPDRRAVNGLDTSRLGLAVALAVAVSLAAPLLTLPRPPAGVPVPAPPVLGAVLVVAAAAAGAFVLHPSPTRVTATATRRLALPELPEVFSRTAVVLVLAGVLVASAVVLWAIGLARGFL